MCLIKKFNKVPLIWLEIIVILASSVLHVIIGFKRPLPDFSAYELFNSSPFFAFYLMDICYHGTENNNFHTWGGGSKSEKYYGDDEPHWTICDETNITKINGYDFCYVSKSYIDLLNNGQIIKNGTECPKKYNKNCGRIDTLNQELCIEEYEKCPLYDIGIGLPPNFENYTYDKESNVYYNNDNYNETNKTIIGKLILNDGQPCYQSSEKLWRQFSSSERKKTHLNCTNIQVFGKSNDDRFIERGNITYRKIYKDNLNYAAREIVFYINSTIGNETVNLYKREFYGLDKKCNEKYNLYVDLEYLRHFQDVDRIIDIVQGVFTIFITSIIICCEIASCFKKEATISAKSHCILFIIYLIVACGSLVIHTMAYIQMVKNDHSDFNCSDSITNEIIRIGNDNNKKVFIYNMISFYTDAIFIFANLIGFIIGLILDKLTENNMPSQSEDSEEDAPYYINYPTTN